jgi:cyclic pyranopterin phosphate synthase
MPEEVAFLPKQYLLTFEEIARVSKIAAGLGINKIRLTGGEPLLRHDLPQLVAMLHDIPGITDLALTTNGILLAKQADALFAKGLRRLNVSLDTLDPEQFRQIARRDSLNHVLEGLEVARHLGFGPIKVNAVAIKGMTENQIVPLALFCRDRGFELRFIEFMPLEADQIWDRAAVLTSQEILDILSQAGLATEPISEPNSHNPAEEYRYTDGQGTLGIIASVSRPFCGSCNRLRITAEGNLRNCLFALDETDLKTPLRSGACDEDIERFFRDCVDRKWEGHQINSSQYVRPPRTMHTIGG